MGRKKRVVEGVVLNLDDFISSDVTIETLLAEMEKKVTPAAKPRKKKSDEEILSAISSKYHCDTCKRYIYASYVKLWHGKHYCDKCYEDIHKDISPEITEYIKEIYSRGCVFCDVKGGRFHFDHINMFTKVNSVMGMVNAGETVEDIKVEIGKCQLLCTDCHMVVTRFELRRGFIRQKMKLNRAIAAGEDVTDMRQKLSHEYDVVMTKMYPLIRAKVREVACVGGFGEASGGGIKGSEIRHEYASDDSSSCGVCDEDF
jgi:protein-arginine kinase activator protein McsA